MRGRRRGSPEQKLSVSGGNGTLGDSAWNPEALFFKGLVLLLQFTLIQILFFRGSSFYSLLHSDTNDTCMDFFNSIFDARTENPYVERGVIYPPLTYVYYRLCGLLLPVGGSPFDWRNSQQGIVLMTAVTAVSIWLLKKILVSGKANGGLKEKQIWLLLLGTVPFWYAMERGNIILQTLLCLAYFVMNYRSEEKRKKELALICLAMAASFKIYPAIFGILLLLDKQYKAAARCIVYGIILFFLPYLFFGGFRSFFTMFDNIAATTNKFLQQGWGYKLNIDNTISALAELFALPARGGLAVKIIMSVLMLYVVFWDEADWKKYMALCGLMILLPGFSYTYTMIFAVLPLFVFLKEEKACIRKNYIYSLLFLGMFGPFALGGYKLFRWLPDYYYNLNLTTLISSLCLIVMMVYLAADTFSSCHLKILQMRKNPE